MCRAVKNTVAKCVTLMHHIRRSRVQVSSRIVAVPVFSQFLQANARAAIQVSRQSVPSTSCPSSLFTDHRTIRGFKIWGCDSVFK